MSRFLYIEHAYKNLALWMKNGSEPVQKLKRYIHRNLALPAKMIHESIDQDEAQECLMEFAHRYIDALLTYCSDILKPGALTNIRSLPRKPLALVHNRLFHHVCQDVQRIPKYTRRKGQCLHVIQRAITLTTLPHTHPDVYGVLPFH